MCYRQGDIDSAHQSLTTMFTFPPENKHESSMEHYRRVPRGDQTTPPPPPPWKRNNFMGLLTDFKREMQQTELQLHACHLVHVKASVNSLLLKHNRAQLNQNGNSADVTKQEKDLTTRLSPSSLRPVSFK